MHPVYTKPVRGQALNSRRVSHAENLSLRQVRDRVPTRSARAASAYESGCLQRSADAAALQSRARPSLPRVLVRFCTHGAAGVWTRCDRASRPGSLPCFSVAFLGASVCRLNLGFDVWAPAVGPRPGPEGIADHSAQGGARSRWPSMLPGKESVRGARRARGAEPPSGLALLASPFYLSKTDNCHV